MIQLVRPHRGPVTQSYGNIQGDGLNHTGNDYGYTSLDRTQVFPEIFAAADGVVLYAGDSRALGWPNPWYFNPDFNRSDAVDSSAGNVVVLGHAQNGVQFVTTYSHAESWQVNKGDAVRAGQRIATTGTTGRSTGKHLHFELLFKPLQFNTATFGRSNPNPYIVEGLAAMGTTTPVQEDEDMAITDDDARKIARFLLDEVVTTEDNKPATLRWFLGSQRKGREEDRNWILDGIFNRKIKVEGEGESGDTSFGAEIGWSRNNFRRAQK